VNGAAVLAAGGLESGMTESMRRIFFALRPPPDGVERIAALADQLKASGGLRARWLKPANYHITAHFLGSHVGLPEDLLACARRAAGSARGAAFDVVLDRIDSFRGREQAPLILRAAPDAERALQSFWRALAAALIGNGLRPFVERQFTPHLTVAYSERALPQPLPIEPIAWTAREFMLIDSHVGEGRHEELARWPLSSA
jgi:2'-5' RNA ligase